MITSFFVYGTLKRGECRESLWPAKPVSIEPAWTCGILYGRGDYPAMIAGNDRVAGECWQFNEVDLPQVLAALDRIEGTNQPGEHDLYLRRSIETWNHDGRSLGEAWTYLYATDPVADGFRRIEPVAVWP